MCGDFHWTWKMTHSHSQVAALDRLHSISDVNYLDMAWDFGGSFCTPPPKNVLKKSYDLGPTRGPEMEESAKPWSPAIHGLQPHCWGWALYIRTAFLWHGEQRDESHIAMSSKNWRLNRAVSNMCSSSSNTTQHKWHGQGSWVNSPEACRRDNGGGEEFCWNALETQRVRRSNGKMNDLECQRWCGLFIKGMKEVIKGFWTSGLRAMV